MERYFELIIVFVLIFSVLGIVLLFSNNANTYSSYYSTPSNLYTEGFQNSGLEYSSYPKHESTDSYTGLMFGGNSNIDCKRIPGHNGLYCTPTTASTTKLDPFYNTSSNMTCEGGFGLQKGSGNVCLDAEQKRLLTTRGGNASGVDSTIA